MICEEMRMKIQPNGIWYHGSNQLFEELRPGSTVTPWRELAEAFARQPTRLSYDEQGNIFHNGMQKGYLYVVDEPVAAGKDVYPHPRTTLDPNAEFLTKRPLKWKRIGEVKV